MKFLEGELIVITVQAIADSTPQDADSVMIFLRNLNTSFSVPMQRVTQGTYEYSFNTSKNSPGNWFFQIMASGNFQGATRGSFAVTPRLI